MLCASPIWDAFCAGCLAEYLDELLQGGEELLLQLPHSWKAPLLSVARRTVCSSPILLNTYFTSASHTPPKHNVWHTHSHLLPRQASFSNLNLLSQHQMIHSWKDSKECNSCQSGRVAWQAMCVRFGRHVCNRRVH